MNYYFEVLSLSMTKQATHAENKSSFQLRGQSRSTDTGARKMP